MIMFGKGDVEISGFEVREKYGFEVKDKYVLYWVKSMIQTCIEENGQRVVVNDDEKEDKTKEKDEQDKRKMNQKNLN